MGRGGGCSDTPESCRLTATLAHSLVLPIIDNGPCSGSDNDGVHLSYKSLYSSLSVPYSCCRVSVSGNMLAVPLDNRHIRIYSLQGNRLAQLPRRNNQVKVCSVR